MVDFGLGTFVYEILVVGIVLAGGKFCGLAVLGVFGYSLALCMEC